MMKIRDIVAPLEEFAPLDWQEEYDNSGLVVGHPDDETPCALVCVDATMEVLDEAQRLGCKLVISHHPVIFDPLRRLNGANNVELTVERAVREGIALYACHTNLDSAPGGMSFRLAEILGIGNPKMLIHTAGPDSPNGFGIIGNLPSVMDTEAFLREVMAKLNLKVVRHSNIASKKIQKIALCAGSAAALIPIAAQAGADIFLAADFKYNNFLSAASQLTIADIGHFESEFCAIDLICDVISKKIPNFVLHKSIAGLNPVSYLYK